MDNESNPSTAVAFDPDLLVKLLSQLAVDLRGRRGVTERLRSKVADVAAMLLKRTRKRRASHEITLREALPQHAADMLLVSRALQGDNKAADEIRRQTEGLVISRIYAMSLGWNEDDLLELVIGRIWDKLALYRGDASLRTWAWTLTVNTLRNWRRDNAAEHRRTQRLSDEDDGRGTLTAPDTLAPDHDVQEGEQQDAARRMLARISEVAAQRLRPEEWELIQRVVMRGEPYATLAAEMNELPATLRARVHRALNRLREELRRELGDVASEYFAAR